MHATAVIALFLIMATPVSLVFVIARLFVPGAKSCGNSFVPYLWTTLLIGVGTAMVDTFVHLRVGDMEAYALPELVLLAWSVVSGRVAWTVPRRHCWVPLAVICFTLLTICVGFSTPLSNPDDEESLRQFTICAGLMLIAMSAWSLSRVAGVESPIIMGCKGEDHAYVPSPKGESA